LTSRLTVGKFSNNHKPGDSYISQLLLLLLCEYALKCIICISHRQQKTLNRNISERDNINKLNLYHRTIDGIVIAHWLKIIVKQKIATRELD